MKRPEPINYETDQEYYEAMVIYQEHLRHVEWVRNGAKRALINLVIIGGIIVIVACVVFKVISLF